MKKSTELVDLKNRSDAAVAKMEANISTLNELIAKLERDVSRSREWVLDAVAEARADVIPILSGELDRLREFWHEAADQQKFWQSSELILSKLVFDDDPAKDAVIKTSLRAEYASMAPPLLQLSYEDARLDGDVALTWLIFCAGRRRRIASDAQLAAVITVNLDGIEVPGQKESLAAIAKCQANLSYGEMIFATASGLRTNPVTKMQIGRLQQQSSRLVAAADGVNPAA